MNSKAVERREAAQGDILSALSQIKLCPKERLDVRGGNVRSLGARVDLVGSVCPSKTAVSLT